MKKFFLLLFSTLLFSVHSISQTFQRAYGTTGSDGLGNVIEVNGGFMLEAGTDSYGAGMGDLVLIKTNTFGDTLWCKAYGGTDNEGGSRVLPTSDGGYILIGYTWSFGPNTPLKSNIYAVKTDSVGNLQWAKAYGGTADDGISAFRQTADSGFILTGSTGNSLRDGFLMKINSVGNVMWVKNYGGAGDDAFSDVEITNDGGYILCGMTGTYSPWTMASWLIRTNANGDTLWTKTYGGPGSVGTLDLTILGGNGGFVMVGNTFNWGAGSSDIYLIKTDTAGNLLWSKTYGGIYDDDGRWVVENANGSLLITGHGPGFENTTWGNYRGYILKVAPDGTFQWVKVFGQGPNDYVEDVLVLTDGYALSGSTGTFGMGGFDGYFIKTDFNGVSGCYEVNNTLTEMNAPTQIWSGGGAITNIPWTAINTATIQSSAPITPTIVCLIPPLGENELNDFDINIYPNPFAHTVTINTAEKGEVEIYNTLGEKIGLWQLAAGKTEIDLSKQTSGIYFVRITTQEGIVTRKIVKE